MRDVPLARFCYHKRWLVPLLYIVGAGAMMSVELGFAARRDLRDRAIRVGAVAGIIAIGWFLAGTTVAAALRPGYSMFSQPASDLGRGQHWWLFTVTLLGFAVLLAMFGAAFSRWLPAEIAAGRRRAIRIWFLVAACGAACGAVFAEFRHGDRMIWHGIFHAVGFVALMLGTIVAGCLTGAALRRVPAARTFAIWTLCSTAVTVTLLVVDLVIPEMVSGVGGILQRVLLIQAFAWHITAGVRMSRDRRSSSSAPV